MIVLVSELPKSIDTKYQSPASVASAINDMAENIMTKAAQKQKQKAKKKKEAIEN